MLQAREDLMKAIQAFLKKYDQIPPKEKIMALLLAEERFLKIKKVVEEEQNQPENIQELLLKLINDLQILNGIPLKQEEQAAKEDEHLSTIPEKESDEFIKSSVVDLVPIPSESEDTSESDSDCDLPSCDDFSPIKHLEEKPVVNPLFDEVLENIESKDSYVSNLDEPALLVAPLSDFNEDECFDPGGDVDEIELLLYRDPYYPSIALFHSRGFTEETTSRRE
ncbi:hypothetical protein Tco_0606769 [Tanacetum coccineum]